MSWWKNHGTKVLGGLTAATNILQATDPAVLAAVIGPKGVSIVGALLGLATIYRGVTNTQTLQDAKPVGP